MIMCRKCGTKIADTAAEFSEMLAAKGKVVKVRTGPPGFADSDEFHAECVGGGVVQLGQQGSLVWHVHENGPRCTGDADLDGINCTGPYGDPNQDWDVINSR